MRRESLKKVIIASLAIALILSSTAAFATEIAFQSVGITPISNSQPYSMRLGTNPVDTDKSHDGTGGWSENWYNDLNANGSHDPGEPFSDIQQSSEWIEGPDNSCWLASACNMLEQLGVINSASDLYADYSLNGVSDGEGGILTWDDGGFQHYAIQQWIDQNPIASAGMTMEVHTVSSTVIHGNGFYAWEDFEPRSNVDNFLNTGWEVGIGMWVLPTNDMTRDWHYGGHALTMQTINSDETFRVTDSDRDGDWIAAGDLNTYRDYAYGPSPFEGHDYYAWFNDFYDGDLMFYPAGDMGYICAVIPEPATLFLTAAGMVMLLRKKRK